MAWPIPAHQIETRHYINGAFTESSDKQKFTLRSPYTGLDTIDVFGATVEDTDRAVAAAKAAFPAWSSLSPAERAVPLKKLAALIREATSELARLEAFTSGRPIAQFFDANMAASNLEHFAEAAYEVKGETSLNTPGFVNISLRQPIGPVAIIIPWNVPTFFVASKAAPALAAGCTVVLKSSEKSPLTPLKIASLAHEAGFPPGVFNFLSGPGTPSGARLAEHMDIRAINFTGSTVTGRKVQMAATTSNLKSVILELGGKSPALIFEDADIQKAAAETMQSMAMLMGQACIANSRIYVRESIAAEFITTFTTIWKGIKMGDPLLPETQQGPQVDSIQHERIKGYLESAKAGKGKLELGGGVVTGPSGSGYFVEPTVYSNVGEDEPAQKDEVFGPFVNINTFVTEEEAIAKANDSEYGLYASVFTKDFSRALRVAKAFESGMVGVNCTSPTVAVDMPAGGYKGSGQGRAGFDHSFEKYLETKAVMMKI